MTPARLAHTADVRREVLDAALSIIDTEGPDAVSMREVARRAGVSHQAPYHYFSDRAGIFAAITHEGFDALGTEFEQLQGTTQHLARDSFRTYLTFAMTHRGHFRVMFRSDICGIPTHDDARLAADRAFNAHLAIVKSIVDEVSGKEDAIAWATLLWSVAHGLATLVIDGPLVAKLSPLLGSESLEQHLEKVIDLFDAMMTQQAQQYFSNKP
jgi:AcrR family transcriptional regulator